MVKANTQISFPSFVRLNINSINLTEAQKQSAMTVNKQLSSQHTVIKSNLVSDGGLICSKDMFVKGKIKTNPQSNQDNIVFDGRVNLTNHTVLYNGAQNYENINNKQPQQYLPFGLFKTIQCNSCMRTSQSGGAVGSGDLNAGAYLWWDSYGQEYYQNNNKIVTVNNTTDKEKLMFIASSDKPKLFRISLYFMKHGGWLDSGVGGQFILGVNSGGKDIVLSRTSCESSTYYRLKTMQCIACTYYATQNGYFYAKNLGSWFRAAIFSWNVVELPFFYNSTTSTP